MMINACPEVNNEEDSSARITEAQRVRSGLTSILIGRPMSAIAGVVTLIMLSRSLAPAAYASYFALWAAVEIVVLASNGGLMHAAYRYVQARKPSVEQRMAIHGPVRALVGLRIMTLPLGVAALLALPVAVFGPVDPSLRPVLLAAFTIVAVTEGLARYCELVFESMVLQGMAQRTVLLRVFIKPIGIGACLMAGPLSLEQVLMIEIIACSSAAVMAVAALWRVISSSELHSSRTVDGEAVTARRVSGFVLPAFGAQLLGLSYGPDVLKLILGSGPDTIALAEFGFAFSLAAMVQRYLPVNFLGGFFRPQFVEAAGREDRNQMLGRLSSVLAKLNWFVIGLPLTFLAPSASQLTSILSKGNYPGAGPVLLLLLLGTAFVASHGILSLYCLAREQSRIPLVATLLASTSLPLIISLAQDYAAVGIAIGWSLSELLWVAGCSLMLTRGVGLPTLRWSDLLRVPAMTMAVSTVGYSIGQWNPSLLWISSFLGPVVLLMMCRYVRVFGPDELAWFSSVAPQRLKEVISRIMR